MKIKAMLSVAVLLFSGVVSMSAQADSRTPGKVIAGWVEKVRLPDNDHVIKAKLDTGAKTSSIHAINVEPFEKDDEPWVRFDVVLDKKPKLITQAMELPRHRVVLIKDHDDAADRRPVVMMDICFDGRVHSTQFSLADRGRFVYPVLLGRRFLKDVAVVDADATFLTQASCGDEDGQK